MPDEELERDRTKFRKEPKDKKPKVAEAPTLEGNDPNNRDRGGPGEDPLPSMAQLSEGSSHIPDPKWSSLLNVAKAPVVPRPSRFRAPEPLLDVPVQVPVKCPALPPA